MRDRILLKGRPVARALVVGSFLSLVGILTYGVIVEPSQMNAVRHTIAVKGLPAQCTGLRLDLVSDTHTGSLNNGIGNLDRMVNVLQKSDADMVVMAGDYVILSVLGGTFVSGNTVANHLRPLAAVKPVYAVLGNHDWWKNGLQISHDFGAAGIQVIDNRAVRVQARGCDFWLVGIGDLSEGHPDIPFALAQTNAVSSLPKIALTHDPKLFPQIPAGVGLTLAGHTHGGQIRIPGFNGYPAFWSKSGAERKYVDGLYREPNGNALFVTRGIGTSIIPVRIGVPPEISQLTLVPAHVQN